MRHSRNPPGCAEKLEDKWQAIILGEFPSGITQISMFLQNSYSSLKDKEDMEEFS